MDAFKSEELLERHAALAGARRREEAEDGIVASTLPVFVTFLEARRRLRAVGQLWEMRPRLGVRRP